MVNILIQWLTMGIVSLVHPFYISMVEINHNAKDATVEISVRVFTEDFEKTLQKRTTTRLDVIKPADNAFLDKQISNYLTEKIKLKVNGQPVTLSYLGHEVQNESVWSYLEIPKISNVKKIELDCSLLYDYEKAQSNIIHVKNGKAEKSFKLDYPKNNAVFDF
ncbi:hypothetical protein GWC95_07555 [Sediminibacterium roseum]|uniref:Peptidase E n=1 Tax=Sediminibacterium roseum TaxID=1978412 RepID=A0ABW9ZRN4_9BACT|nr:DUF6702 family protein [Sediminibacterium roseum]NCI49772.1 hypothetical protein [Sediminibacterium roseum]